MADGFGLEGRGAMVVGAGQGIGRATALGLARAGCDLALVDCEAARIESVAGEIRALGRRAELLVADVCEGREADALAGRAQAALGRLDVLVNIVGQASWAPLLEMDEATWDRDHALNLKQHWRVAASAARLMRDAEGGSVVTIASVSGMFSAAGHAAYGAAKAGLVSLVKSMAEEWFDFGVRVNAVAPGAVLTPRIQAMWDAGEVPRPKPAVLACMALPEDIANAAVFLSSPLARRISGHTLVVDGGKTTRFPFELE